MRRNQLDEPSSKLDSTIPGMIAALLLWSLYPTSAASMDNSYIISARRLNALLGDEELVILDARDAASYAKGHIPGAINVAWEHLSKTDTSSGRGWGTALPKDKLERALAKIGISNDSKVVVYADPKSGWGEDGRILWTLRLAGHEASQMLDGGFKAWTDAGLPASVKKPSIKTGSYFITTLRSDLSADTEWILAHKRALKILDSRKRSEFDGAVEFGEARGGHIPGSVHFHYRRVFRPSGLLKSPAELVAMLTAAGIKKTDEIAVYCTAGIRSAHLTMILRMLGFKRARNYDQSFYRWAADKNLPLD